jgi:hypothetical protein
MAFAATCITDADYAQIEQLRLRRNAGVFHTSIAADYDGRMNREPAPPHQGDNGSSERRLRLHEVPRS